VGKCNRLNVKVHLNHVKLCCEAFTKYGDCPAIREELLKLAVINKLILKKHESKNTRKDIYINSGKEQS